MDADAYRRRSLSLEGRLSRYTSATDADRAAMLDAIGVGSVEELFADIPATCGSGARSTCRRAVRAGGLRPAARRWRRRNVSPRTRSASWAPGMYDHYVPALIDMLLSRSEFLTPYTPYQPEISQGGLQVMFEYQTAISRADRPAGLQRLRLRGPERRRPPPATWRSSAQRRRKLVVSARPAPALARDAARPTPRATAPRSSRCRCADGATDPEALAAAIDDDTGAVFLQQPNFFGAVEDLERAGRPAPRRRRAASSCAADPIPLGILKPPGELGVDIVRRRGPAARQPPGLRRPVVRLLRRRPRRSCGACRAASPARPTDVDGQRGFVLTLQTREQHIRREKATSNICTAQALNALAGVVYLAWLGGAGWSSWASCCCGAPPTRARPWSRSTASRRCTSSRWCASSRVRCRWTRRSSGARPSASTPSTALDRGLPLERRRPAGGASPSGARAPTSTGWPRCWARPCASERRGRPLTDDRCTRPGIEGSAQRPARPRSTPAARPPDDLRALARGPARLRAARARRARAAAGRAAARAPAPRRGRAACPRSASRSSCATTCACRAQNFHLDEGFYPLGSCTMKHNPKLHERVAALPGHARLHPLQDPQHAQGALELMWRLQGALGEIAGLPHVSLQPQRGLARRAGRRAAHARLPRGPRRARARRSSRPTPRTAPTRRR